MFSILHNLATQDPYIVSELGQSCRYSVTNGGPAVQLGCLADATGQKWDTFNDKKTSPPLLEPLWENPARSPLGSTWGDGVAGTGFY